MASDVVTGAARLSFVHLFKPRSVNNSDPKYSVTVLLPKSDSATRTRIDTAIEAAKQTGVSKCWAGAMPPRIDLPIYDGDGVRPSDGTPFGAECRGCWVFSASCKTDYPPYVVDKSCQPIMNQTEIYSGAYGRVAFDVYPYNSNGKKGVGFGLNGVQKIADGEPLASRSTPEDDFGPRAQQSYQQPAYAAPAPPAYQAPPTFQQPAYQAPAYAAPAQPFYQQEAQINPFTGQPV